MGEKVAAGRMRCVFGGVSIISYACRPPWFGILSPCSETETSGTPITGSARFRLRKEKPNDDYYLTKQFCVATATGCSENREFSKPAQNRPSAPKWARLGVLLCKALRGASDQGATSSRLFFFRFPVTDARSQCSYVIDRSSGNFG
jgi:hypothetical protein